MPGVHGDAGMTVVYGCAYAAVSYMVRRSAQDVAAVRGKRHACCFFLYLPLFFLHHAAMLSATPLR